MLPDHQITVAIPVYNGQKYILDALQSIINQTHKVDNILVCDNQSTDDTVNIVREFFKNHKEINCKLKINDSNLGYQKNFNKCMELAETEYLLLLAADDRLKPDTIEITKDFLDSNPEYAFAGGYADSIDSTGKIIHEQSGNEDQFFKKGQVLEFLKKNRLYIIPSSVLMRMNFIRKIGYWDLDIGPDERFWPKVIKNYPVAILKDCLVERRIHNEQTAILDYVKKYDGVIHSLKQNLIVASYESTPSRINEARKLISIQNSSSSMMMGNLVIKNFNEYSVGLKYLLFCITQSPSYKTKFRYTTKAAKIFLTGIIHSSHKSS